MRKIPEPRPALKRPAEKDKPPRFALVPADKTPLQLAGEILEREDLALSDLREVLGLLISYCEGTG